MNLKILCSVILFISLLPLAAFGQSVAVVGSKSISLQEFKEKYDEIKKPALNVPSPEVFLEDLVRYEVGFQEAEKRGLQNDPLVKERLRQEMYKALIEKEIGKKINAIKVSESEIIRYYNANPDLKTSHILIEFKLEATPKEKAEAKKRAEEILAEVKSSKREFGELARLYSDDVNTKNNGGDVGFQNRLTVVPAYYEAASRLKVGQISGLVETKTGFHIIKLVEKRAYKDITDKRALRAAVFDTKRKVVFDDYFKKLKSRYKIKLNPSAIKGI